MEKMSSIKRMIICAVCTALCYVLPMVFHATGIGRMLLPMHIPVLLCGILCGPCFGAMCGAMGPVLSSVLSGMPSPVGLISMVPELMAYGLVTGLVMRLLRTGKTMADIYIALICAMVIGRIVGGVADALFLLGSGEGYSVAMFVGSYLAGCLPGVVVQLITVPVLTLTLEKARVIPARYGDGGSHG